MENNQIYGIISIIIGLLLILFPAFSSGFISLIIGVVLFLVGITSIIAGIQSRQYFNSNSSAYIILGIIAVIFGLLFIFEINALSFLISLQFYIIGFILIAYGIIGAISGGRVPIISALIGILLGIIAIILAILSMSQPIYLAIIIGIYLIIQGIMFFFDW